MWETTFVIIIYFQVIYVFSNNLYLKIPSDDELRNSIQLWLCSEQRVENVSLHINVFTSDHYF